MPAVAMTGTLAYDNQVWRGLAGGIVAGWRPGQPTGHAPDSTWGESRQVAADAGAPWRRAQPVGDGLSVEITSLRELGQDTAVAWQRGAPLGTGIDAPVGGMDPVGAGAAAPWQAARPVGQSVDAPQADAAPVGIAVEGPWRIGAPVGLSFQNDYRVGRSVSAVQVIPWQGGGLLIGISPDIVIPVQPDPDQYVPTPDLLYACVWEHTGDLFFQYPCAWLDPGLTIIVPVRRAYVMNSSASLIRVSDGAHIPCTAAGFNLDWDSWVWTAKATLAGHGVLALLSDSEPTEVDLTINGVTGRFLAETIERGTVFGSNTASLTGRGIAAYLADPYSAFQASAQPSPRTMVQLADELVENSGWTIDWRAPSWLVPGGVWAHAGTPMEGLIRLAEAAGACIVPNPLTKVLVVQSKYPVLPWDWADAIPDIQIPPDVLTKISLAPEKRPSYNSIWVSGQGQGVLARVVRAGTTGEIEAQQIVDPLCTDALAARARGGLVLAGGGRVAVIGLVMPVSADIPMLGIGQLVEVAESTPWRGLVTSVGIGAQLSADGLKVRQSANVIRHYAD